jgi:hypothetical protein
LSVGWSRWRTSSPDWALEGHHWVFVQAMKLLSLRFFGYSQTSMRQGNIFASGLDLSHQLDQFALSRAVEGLEKLDVTREWEAKIAPKLGFAKEQLMKAAHGCYATSGVKLYSVQREDVDLRKSPEPQQIYRDIHADVLWPMVSVQLAGSRYAMRTPEMCNNMPPAYTKEVTCNGELMPQVCAAPLAPHTTTSAVYRLACGVGPTQPARPRSTTRTL